MKQIEYIYEVRSMIELTEPDILRLIKNSRAHYDGYCRSVSSPGERSFLHGWKVMLNLELADKWNVPMSEVESRQWASEDTTIKIAATSHQLDTCCKILEVGREPEDAKLYCEFRQALVRHHEEQERQTTGPVFHQADIENADQAPLEDMFKNDDEIPF